MALATASPTPASKQCLRWFAVSMARKPAARASTTSASVRSSFQAVP
jgi:hypothetical protein